METIRGSMRAMFALGAACAVLYGCEQMKGGNTSADWARAALERNNNLTVVAFDEKANTFTVRLKPGGELRVVRADEVVGTLPDMSASTSEPATAPAAAESAESTAEQSTEPSNAVHTDSRDTERARVGEIARPAEDVNARYPGDSARDTSNDGTGVIQDARTGDVLASTEPGEGTKAEDAGSARDRKVIASGPGYSIRAGDPTPPAAVRLASRSAEIPSPARGVAVEKRSEPLICQGPRLLHIDGRNLEFEGDAVTAEDGCELHITNSHIIAHGVGISARAANVHVQNSVVEGDAGSVSASEGAQVYTQQSTFRGLSRRLDTASIHDLGGTVWN